MIPFDVVETLHTGLKEMRREPDGLLHCSSDILGSLRHAQLRLAGAPTIASELVSDVRLMTGTMWHEFMGELFRKRGVHFQNEINVNEGLPEGWGGTADFLFYKRELNAFGLKDLKTIKGEGIRWIREGGAKEEHIYQVSAYWHALIEMGYRMVETFDVIYLPMNDTPDKNDYIEPLIMECRPVPKDVIWGIMEERWEGTQRYLHDRSVSSNYSTFYLADELAPEKERIQKMYWNGSKSVFELKLVPHWSTKYCPYPNELCSCSEQGTTKIGEFSRNTICDEINVPCIAYSPRLGYEEYEPQFWPTENDFHKKEKVS